MPKFIQTLNLTYLPAWEKCECCDDYICNVHGVHTSECDCPPIEDWINRGVDPYINCIAYTMNRPKRHRKFRPMTYHNKLIGVIVSAADWGGLNWIKVTDELPEKRSSYGDWTEAAAQPSKKVLVWADGFKAPRAGVFYHTLNLWQVDGIDTLGQGYPVTHWAEFNTPKDE